MGRKADGMFTPIVGVGRSQLRTEDMMVQLLQRMDLQTRYLHEMNENLKVIAIAAHHIASKTT